MAIKGSFYATSGTDRPYYYYDYNTNFADVFSNGVFTLASSLTDEMEVSGVSATMKSQVNLGVAYVEGIRSEIYTAAEQVTHDAADVSNPRIDTVCLEVNTTAGVRNSRIVIVKGTAAGSPTAPDLTQTATVWQMPLADVRINAGVTNAANFVYTDRRVKSTSPISLAVENIEGEIPVNKIEGAGDIVGARYYNSGVTYSTSGYTIQWPSPAEYDPSGSYDAGQPTRMTVMHSGVYTVSYVITAGLSPASPLPGSLMAILRKNGASVSGSGTRAANWNTTYEVDYSLAAVVDCLELIAGDYLELYAGFSSQGGRMHSALLSMRLNRL